MESLLDNESLVAFILVVSFLILNILGNFAFHVITKGNHFREWKEFEPLDAPTSKTPTGATVYCDPQLRSACYNLLVSTLSVKLNHPQKDLTSERTIYLVLKYFFPDFLPNSSVDNSDTKFSLLVLRVISKVQAMEVAELRKFMQETFPNSNF